MNILIVIPKYNLSIKENYTYNFPLGLAYISAVLKKKGYNVTCFNLNHYAGTTEELLTKVLSKKKYDMICSGGNSLIYELLRKITYVSHNHSTHPIVVIGGPAITSEPKIMFDLIKPDFAVVGEGEITIVELLEALEDKKDFARIKGIVYKEDGRIILTPNREPIAKIESLPFPDFEGMEFSKYLDNMHCNDSWDTQVFDYPRSYPLLGSRGCPFQCTFCWHPEKYRERSVDDIMKELEFVVEREKINIITIYDDCFSANKERIYEFCKKIKEFAKKLPWDLKWSCQLLVNSVDEGMLRVMKDAGCINISYGFESFSPIVLKSMKKPITPEGIDKALKETLKAKMSIRGNFIFGDIAETEETATKTLQYWKSCPEAQQISLGFVQPYPGSELYNHCIRKNIIKDKLFYIRNQMGPDTRLNMTASMTNEKFAALNIKLLDVFKKYFNFVSPRSLSKMSKHTYEFDFKCPFCKQTTHYANCFIENKLTYGFHLICRKCGMRSVLVGPAKKIAYKHYTKTRAIRDYLVRAQKLIKRKQA